MTLETAHVVSVARSPAHAFSKIAVHEIRLIAGEGVEGDAHRGVTVKHRSRVRVDPTQPNLRQVHLLAAEILDELVGAGFHVGPGTIGENVLTRGIDLLSLPRGTQLTLGEEAVVEITGLRNPCSQLDGYEKGLTAALLSKDEQGGLVRRAGVMAVVINGGWVVAGDDVAVALPPEPWVALDRV